MKKYLTWWMFLDMGMEGIPSMDTPKIVEARDLDHAKSLGPYFSHGYGCSTVIGEIDGDKVTAIDAYPHCNDWTKAENKYYCDAVNRLYSDATNNTYVYDKPKTEKSFIPKIFKIFSRR